jgi:hypothetical protein
MTVIYSTEAIILKSSFEALSINAMGWRGREQE